MDNKPLNIEATFLQIFAKAIRTNEFKELMYKIQSQNCQSNSDESNELE